MKSVPLTDSRLSHVATEFVWDMAGSTTNHDFLIGPVLRLLNERRPRSLLDLGCGNGSFTALLAAHGFNADGCDGSESGIRIARETHPRLTFWHQDLNSPLAAQHAGQYDAVVSTEVIEHLLLPRRLMLAALQALRPGGLLIVTAPYHGYWKNLALAVTGKFDSHWHPLRDFGHVKFFSRATLTDLFAEFGLNNIAFSTVGRIPALARSMIVSGIKPE